LAVAEEVIAINIVAVAEGGVFIISATIEEEKEEEIEEGTGAETGTKTTTMGAEEESEEETTETTTTSITTTTTTEEEEEKEEGKEEVKKEENCRTRRESSRINASSINTSGLTRIHLRAHVRREKCAPKRTTITSHERVLRAFPGVIHANTNTSIYSMRESFIFSSSFSSRVG
jgi:hypothetical protein